MSFPTNDESTTNGKVNRRFLLSMNAVTQNKLQFCNPYIVMMWSVMLPGFGHYYLGHIWIGFVMMSSEVLLNNAAFINTAIYYSFHGQIDEARAVLVENWYLGYVGFYIFAIWDSYRLAVQGNKQFLLAYKEDAPIRSFYISPMAINYLDKRKPWLAYIWSWLIPGLGHVYLHNLTSALFAFVWVAIIAFNSNFGASIHFSILGNFEQAKEVLNIQWFLFLPSVYAFASYHAYAEASDLNQLFEIEQSRYLKSNYQSSRFKMPKALR
ncbi:hypothetical protein [Bacillus alkalicellulosilyticus]|uniref:hypothetical protein n=1 Tax=Alkalihalobacterium alkalicellulosilyticum TaxID=1912214 RepID=UPI000998D977|nr:hypothetical protein [Bacillus alkalicellulosilyticus]